MGVPGSSSVGGVSAPLGWKLLWLAQASRSVPYTVKCSEESNSCCRACARTAAKNAWAMAPGHLRCRVRAKRAT